MSKNKWMKALQDMEGAVDSEYNPFLPENIIQTGSPSLNWIFGKGAGLPLGFSAVLFGPPKSGKSLISNLMVGHLHKTDSEAYAIKFNTEMREEGQMADYWGIDHDRYIAYNVNAPELIFDRIVNEIQTMVQDGMPLKLIIIDSLQGIGGVKFSKAESIVNHQIGDDALTIQKGLKMILPVIRKHRIALVCTAHVRANLDAGMYGPKEKMAGAWAQRHFFEYFVNVNKDRSQDGKSDLMGNKFENDGLKDFKGNKEITGHKIYVKMEDTSNGKGVGRTGEFTLSYENGLINTHEEVFELAKNTNIVERPNNRTYIYDGVTYTSKEQFANALKDEKLANKVLSEIYKKDL